MDCRQAQDELFELWDERRFTTIPERLDAHVADCPGCQAFVAKQTALDVRLDGLLAPPELSSTFRSSLKQRIRRESPRVWPDTLPDIVHFTSCAAATLLCALLLPFAAGPVLAVGGVATAITYVLIVAARIWFEA